MLRLGQKASQSTGRLSIPSRSSRSSRFRMDLSKGCETPVSISLLFSTSQSIQDDRHHVETTQEAHVDVDGSIDDGGHSPVLEAGDGTPKA